MEGRGGARAEGEEGRGGGGWRGWQSPLQMKMEGRRWLKRRGGEG
jgi:hypothetical protein